MENEFSLPVRVYIEDTDAGGIVYYVNYLKYMERARTELLRSLGLSKPAILENGLIMVVASATINYKKPARLDDELCVSAKIKRNARTYILFQQKIMLGQQCLSDGEIKIACVNQTTMRPCPFPSHIVSLLEGAPSCGDQAENDYTHEVKGGDA